MLINVKMPTIVGILTFMSGINFVLSRVEYEKSFITSGPGYLIMEPMNNGPFQFHCIPTGRKNPLVKKRFVLLFHLYLHLFVCTC